MIVFACGGTGGHVYPAIAVAQLFPKNEVHFFTSTSRQDRQIIPRYGFSFSEIPSSNRNPVMMGLACLKSLLLLKKKKAKVVVGTGSYLTGPVVLAAWLLRLPIVLMEQNVIPGRVNRKLYPLCKLLCVSFKETLPYFPSKNITVTGNPLRQTFGEDSYSQHLQRLSFSSDKKVLVFGGSQASNIFNKTVLEALETILTGDLTWIVIVGASEFKRLRTHYSVPDGDCITIEHHGNLKLVMLPYTENMNLLYGVADVVVCRSGASSVTELLAYQKPAVLVPYPFAKDNHQQRNAEVFCDEGLGRICPQEKLTFNGLLEDIRYVLAHSYEWKPVSENAAEVVKKEILQFVR